MYSKISTTLSFLLLSTITFAHNITIKINGAPKTKFYLGYYYGDKQYIRDSATTDAKGVVVFKGNETLEGGVYLIASADKSLLFDFVVTEQTFSLETDTSDYTGKMKVKGSPENEVFFAYSKFASGLSREASVVEKRVKAAKEKDDTAAVREAMDDMDKIEKRLNDYRDNVVKQHPTFLLAKIFSMMSEVDIPESPILPNGRKDSSFQYYYFREHYFDKTDLNDNRLVYTPVFHNKMETYMTKVVVQIPDSISLAADNLIARAKKSREISKWCIYWITNHYETSQFMGMDAVFVHMVEKYYNDTQATFWVDDALRYKIVDRADILKNTLIGNAAANLTMPDTSGRYQSLYNIKAKYTFVLFWDATCGRCKEEIPKLKELYEKLNSKPAAIPGLKNFEVYAVSLTADAEEWRTYVKKNELKWINVSDLKHETNFRRMYDVYSTPVVYLLDKDKKIVVKRLTVEQVEDYISKGIE